MSDKKILEVIERYRQLFKGLGITAMHYPDDDLLDSPEYKFSLAHCHGMLDQIIDFMENGRKEKACRWLGFIQGVLWLNKIYTIGDLKSHSRLT